MLLKLEEYAPTGSLVLESFKRNKIDFVKYNTKMDSGYLNSFETALNKLNTMESTYSMTEEQKRITLKLYEQCDLILQKMLFMKVFAKAAKLDCKIITKISTSLRRRNVEGSIKELQDALEHYENNKQILLANGMPSEFLDELLNMTDKIKTYNNEQNDYFRIRAEKIAQKKILYSELYKFITEICETGKAIYCNDEIKRKEFTLVNIISIFRAPNLKKKNNNTNVNNVPDLINPIPEASFEVNRNTVRP